MMLRKLLFGIVISGVSLAVSACAATESTATESAATVDFEALYGPEAGVVPTRETVEELDRLELGNSELEIVVDGKAYAIHDKGLQAIIGSDAYPFFADGVEIGTLSIVGSAVAPKDDNQSVTAQGTYCFAWQTIGCCSNGANQRRLCCTDSCWTGGYYQYRCASGPC